MAANVTQRIKYVFYRKEAFYFRRAITLKRVRTRLFMILFILTLLSGN